MKNSMILSFVAVFALVATAARADRDDEKVVYTVKKLDTKARLITTYEVPALDPTVTRDALDKIKPEDAAKIVAKFIARIAVKANQVSEEKATFEVSDRGADKDDSTPAHGWGWRGYGGGWVGYGYRGFYRRAAYAYNPYWGYGSGCGYYGGGWGGYASVTVFQQPAYPVYQMYYGEGC